MGSIEAGREIVLSTVKINAVTVEADGLVADSHFYFRGCFSLPAAGRVTLKVLAASWFEACLDGEWLAEGPARFDKAHPEYEAVGLDLDSGEHVLAMHVHYAGVLTRLMAEDIPLFVFTSVEMGGRSIAVEWRYLPLDAYRKTGQQIDYVLGWIEWCETQKLPPGWKGIGFDDSDWPKAVPLVLAAADFKALEIGRVRHIRQKPRLIDEGMLGNTNMNGDDPTSAFLARRLLGNEMPAQGRWIRFDLGKIRLGRAEISLDVPAGTVVQAGYSESLANGRVVPDIAACVGGDSKTCNLDHFVARGGGQTLKPLHPKGARFLEIHVFGDPVAIRDVEVAFEERVYYGEQVDGSFSCNDGLLDRIWAVGVETLRSCSEDAITDNPTRERGQWLGDAVGAGMDIIASAYSDMRPLRRGLLQAAQCAEPDGMIPALFPGSRGFLSSFAVQWIYAIPHYFEIIGERDVLETLYPAAVETLRCFDADLSEEGLCVNPSRPNFIDWGYRGSSASSMNGQHAEMDPALSLFYLKALHALGRWASLLGKANDAAQWAREEAAFCTKMQTFLQRVDGQVSDWEKIGYHSAALALGSGLLETPQSRAACVEYIKQHILSCFPNSSTAPRLSDPAVTDSQLITPFFAHHVFPILIEAGEMDFVLEQFRVCWGWALDEGLTTWPEVFDRNWSHCHQWSGCPTWILSRYVLGLHPRFDLGENHYLLNLETGSLDSAEGIVPISCTDETISVSWRRTDEGIRYRLETTTPIWLHLSGEDQPVQVVSGYQMLLEGRKDAVASCELV